MPEEIVAAMIEQENEIARLKKVRDDFEPNSRYYKQVQERIDLLQAQLEVARRIYAPNSNV